MQNFTFEISLFSEVHVGWNSHLWQPSKVLLNIHSKLLCVLGSIQCEDTLYSELRNTTILYFYVLNCEILCHFVFFHIAQ